MGCDVTNSVAASEPLWANENKGYDATELTHLNTLIDQTLAWFVGNGLSWDNTSVASKMAVGIRVGVPYMGKDDTVDADTVYNGIGIGERLIKTMGLDALKITIMAKPWGYPNGLNNPAGYIDSSGKVNVETYTYKSKYIHRIFGEYFINGIDNKSGIQELDNIDMILSDIAPLYLAPHGANDAPVAINPTKPLPTYIVECFQMSIQNIGLFKGLIPQLDPNNPSTRVKKGDVIYFSALDMLSNLWAIKYSAAYRLSRLASPSDNQIHDVLTTTGIDDAMKQLQYGGTLATLRVVLRIPASRYNQSILEGLLKFKKGVVPPTKEVFSEVFKEEWLEPTSKYVDNSAYKNELTDEYSTDMGVDNTFPTNPPAWDLDEVYNNSNGVPSYGCHEVIVDPADGSTYDRYRYFLISDDWLREATPSAISILFNIGIDLTSLDDTPCPYDTLIAIILVIVLTFSGDPPGAIAIIAMVIQIGVILGAFGTGDFAKVMQAIAIALAVYNSYDAMVEKGFTGTAITKFSIDVANAGLQIAKMVDAYMFEKEAKGLKDDIKSLEQDAELYESNMRLMYGESYSNPVRHGPEANPYLYLEDMYSKFESTPGQGFLA